MRSVDRIAMELSGSAVVAAVTGSAGLVHHLCSMLVVRIEHSGRRSDGQFGRIGIGTSGQTCSEEGNSAVVAVASETKTVGNHS